MRRFYTLVIKRFFDILFSLIAIPFVIVIIIPVAIAIFIEDHGPIFYIDKRLGKNTKEFGMLKLRTMKVNSPDIRNEDGSTYNSINDPRLTKIGKFLRKTSIDELPQVFNILIGQMSFIGPRPSPLGNLDKYPKFYLKKFTVLPGLTGYDQSNGRNSNSMEEHFKSDVYYVEHISLWLDIKIIFKTIPTVLLHRGVFRNNDNDDKKVEEQKSETKNESK